MNFQIVFHFSLSGEHLKMYILLKPILQLLIKTQILDNSIFSGLFAGKAIDNLASMHTLLQGAGRINEVGIRRTSKFWKAARALGRIK